MAAAVLVLSLLGSTQAWADDTDVQSNAFQDGTKAKVEVVGARLGDTVKGPGMPAWLRACTWRRWTLLEKEAHLAQFFSGGAPSRAGLIAAGKNPDEPWYVVFCNAGPEAASVAPGVLVTGVLSTWRVGNPLRPVINDWLVAYAAALIAIPVQDGISSPLGDRNAPLIAQLETWLWVQPNIWTPVSATTPPVFGVTATVTATPYRVEYRNSEGAYVDCGNNMGRPYNLSLPVSAQSTRCSLTYHDASSVAHQTLTSTIRWRATWACSSSCGMGRLPDFVITNTRDVRVAELLGIGTAIGSNS